MNVLIGKIVKVNSNDYMSIIEMSANNELLKTIVIETPSTAPFLKTGNRIKIMFKETEVSIAKDFSGGISLQNKIKCNIKEIKKGKLLSYILLDFNGIEISSVITSSAVDQLKLKINNTVTALIKTNEIIISP
ncbi:MAG TPA: tobe domain protein [Ignavibacteria bacterium]|nr:tobe domain protein [Ignavibacteria bacterium]